MNKNKPEQFNLSFVRHGKKGEIGERDVDLENSGLTPQQQDKWKQAVELLELKKVELDFEALPEIEKKANEIIKSLPKEALLIFLSTDFSRNRLTTELLMNEILEATKTENKDIRVAYFLETAEEKQDPDSLKSNLSKDMMHLMDEIRQQDFKDDQLVGKYFEHGGNLSISIEDEMVKKAANMDLARGEKSYLKARGKLFRKQYEELKKDFSDQNLPVFFYGVTHHSAMIALDAEFNERKKYNNVDEIPKPLSLWEAKTEKK